MLVAAGKAVLTGISMAKETDEKYKIHERIGEVPPPCVPTHSTPVAYTKRERQGEGLICEWLAYPCT